eukprot:TRINITY_DN1037_c3_g1_i2.p1 TRINITY_DN1037_c3_g1~~TRINITY_DN1037_c3_g1_i2.p1  ORF type:complete len:300 (+),score=66.09 TRINITY_DN1037_c3_g1_i2:57-902(+)
MQRCLVLLGLCVLGHAVCTDYNSPADQCGCTSDPNCTWLHEASGSEYCIGNTCPNLDLAILIDGSGSMSGSFGNHTHGFYGPIELLQDWVQSVPLAGDDHTASPNVSSTGFRITFLQFSNATFAGAHPEMCSAGNCTNGLLSGSLDELQGDLQWHEANFQAGWTYLHPALLEAGSTLNSSAQGMHPERKQVVIIIADGGLTDLNGTSCDGVRACNGPMQTDPSYKSDFSEGLLSAVQVMRDAQVPIFGVGLRRSDNITDAEAELGLEAVVTAANCRAPPCA